MNLPLTMLLAGIFALMMVMLSIHVSLRRIALRGDVSVEGVDDTLRRRIRAHGNFAEYAPTALILLGLLEYRVGDRPPVIAIAIAFLVGRVAHAFGMLFTSSPVLRAPAMTVQHAAFVAAGGWLIFLALS